MANLNLDSIIWNLKYLSTNELNDFIIAAQKENQKHLDRLKTLSVNDKVFINGNFGDYHECNIEKINLEERNLVVTEPGVSTREHVEKVVRDFTTLEEFRNLRIF